MNFAIMLSFLPLLIGITTLLIGILAVVKPKEMSSKFGIAALEPALPYVVSTGIRDVFMGLTVLILFCVEHHLALGLVHLAIGVVAISDFMVVRKYGKRPVSYVHLAGAIAVISYGTWLLSSTVLTAL